MSGTTTSTIIVAGRAGSAPRRRRVAGLAHGLQHAVAGLCGDDNIVNSTQGERACDVEMAATLLTAVVPLAVYFPLGRWFVRGSRPARRRDERM